MIELDLSNPLSPSGTLAPSFDMSKITEEINSINSLLSTAQSVVNVAGSTINAAIGVSSALVSIGGIVPPGYFYNPSVKDQASGPWNSPKAIAYAARDKAKDIVVKKVEYVKNAIGELPETALNTLLNMIDPLLEQLIDKIEEILGIGLEQLYYLCNVGLKIYRTYKMVKKFNGEQNRRNQISLPDNDGNNPEKSRSGLNASISLDKEQLKKDLKEWLDQQIDAIWNGFLIITIIDEIKEIKEVFTNLFNASNDNIESQMNSLDGLVEFLDFLGLSEDQAPAGIGVAALEGNINAYKNLLGNVGKDYAIGLASGIGNSFMETLGDSLKNNVKVSIKRKFQIKTTGETGVIEILMHADPNKTNNVGDLVAELNSIRLFSAASVTSIVAKAKEVWKSEKDDDSDSNRFQSTSPTMHVKVIFRYKPDSSTENSSTQSDDAGLTPQLTISTIDEGVVQDGASTHIVSNLLSTAISVLRTLMPQLELIAHLVSNYKTNKARYLSSSSLKISSILSLVKKAQGWLSSNDDEFEPLVIEDQHVATLISKRLELDSSTDSSTKELNRFLEIVIGPEDIARVSDLLESSANLDSSIHLFLNPNNVNKNFEVDLATGTVYYADPNLPESDSEILEHLNDKEEPELSIEDLLTVYNDDSEGGVISLEGICGNDSNGEQNLPNPSGIKSLEEANELLNSEWVNKACELASIDPSSLSTDDAENLLSNIPEPIGNKVIIEFARDSIKGLGIEYSLYDTVRGGTRITSDTIFGTCIQNNSQRKIKSIFDSGTVRSVGDSSVIAKVLPKTYRHFIIDDCRTKSDTVFTEDEMNQMKEDFEMSNNLFTFISNNLCLSVLPHILCEREEEPKTPLVDPPAPNGYTDIWPVWKDHYKHTRDNFYRQFEEMSDDNKMKEIRDTGANPKKIKELADKKIQQREDFISWKHGKHQWDSSTNGIIDLYENYKTKLDKCGYDPSFGDAKGLGLSYYVDLLASIDLTVENFAYAQEYYDLISKIATRRCLYEENTRTDIENVINHNGIAFMDIVGSQISFIQYMDSEYEGDYTFTKIFDFLKNDALNAKQKQDSTISSLDATTEDNLRRLANLYLFYIEHSADFDDKDSFKSTEELNYEILTKEERDQIESFWSKVINDYKTRYNMPDLIEALKEKSKSRLEDTIWPVPINITIKGESYKLYLFTRNPNEDSGLANYDDSFSEEIPESIEEPTLPSSEGLSAEAPANAKDLLDDNSGSLIPNENGGDNSTETEVPITDVKYWTKYFSIATAATLFPVYWATGLVIPPAVYILLPAIYVCLTTIFIKEVNFLIVIGLSIRGIFIEPLILYVNLDSDFASITLPLKMMLNRIKDTFRGQIENMENIIPNLIQIQINKMEAENDRLKRENIELSRMQDELKAIQFPGLEALKKAIKSEIRGRDPRQMVRRLQNM